MASKVQTSIIKKYKKNGWLVLNLVKASANGFGDLICFKEGCKPLFIESKEWNDTVSELQKYRGREVQKYGCEFIIIQGEKPKNK